MVLDGHETLVQCASAEELLCGTGTEGGSAGGNDEMGVKEECEARRGQSAVALLSSKLSPPRPVSRQSHVLNLTKFGFAVRASRAGHVHHSRTS